MNNLETIYLTLETFEENYYGTEFQPGQCDFPVNSDTFYKDDDGNVTGMEAILENEGNDDLIKLNIFKVDLGWEVQMNSNILFDEYFHTFPSMDELINTLEEPFEENYLWMSIVDLVDELK